MVKAHLQTTTQRTRRCASSCASSCARPGFSIHSSVALGWQQLETETRAGIHPGVMKICGTQMQRRGKQIRIGVRLKPETSDARRSGFTTSVQDCRPRHTGSGERSGSAGDASVPQQQIHPHSRHISPPPHPHSHPFPFFLSCQVLFWPYQLPGLDSFLPNLFLSPKRENDGV